MAQHKLFTKETDMQVCFCHPKSPWERGTNENTNGLLRQSFPRGLDLNKFTARQIKLIQDEFNDRPRKALDWYSPHEYFSKLLQ
ncbi:MAG: IS30 family transposase [Candidatus Omnitrophica bacterium]|nr:IS30 family transposase [Candidatus Omnitrophota bacterium]